MKDSPFNKRIAELEDEITVRETELKDLRQQRADYYCPFKVGDVLIDRHGKKCVLTRISAGYFGDGYRLRGRNIKKDGALGLRVNSLYDWDEWRKV